MKLKDCKTLSEIKAEMYARQNLAVIEWDDIWWAIERAYKLGAASRTPPVIDVGNEGYDAIAATLAKEATEEKMDMLIAAGERRTVPRGDVSRGVNLDDLGER